MILKARYILTFLRLNPAVLILAGLLNGIIPFFVVPDDPFYQGVAISLVSVILLFILLYSIVAGINQRIQSAHSKSNSGKLDLSPSADLFSVTRVFISVAKFAVFTFIGWSLSFYSTIPFSKSYMMQLPHSNCGAEIKVRFLDKTDPGDAVKWLSHPLQVEAEVLEMRISHADKWKKCSGKVMLKFPDKRRASFSGNKSHKYSSNSNIVQPLDYGNEAILYGAFIEPEHGVFKGDFDYKFYLRRKGIYKLYYVSSIEKLTPQLPLNVLFMQKILLFRNKIMCMMSDGMESGNRRMLAALMFGCRQGLDFASRRTFLQSGVIHIFAISGLHVGMIAITLYLLLSWTPFRFRYLFVPCLLSLYVITTGMHTSALRALIMISVWSIMKAFFYRTSPLNIVFLSASIMLILNPLELFGAGFQFSFSIAAFLVLAWGAVKEWVGFLQERTLWIPSGLLSFKDHIVTRLKRESFNSFITSLIAWLSGSVILLMHRALFIPGAVFTNFIIIPFVWLLFVVALFDLLLMPFYHFFTLNPIMEILLNIIRGISSVGAEMGGGINLPTPPFYIAILFFLALIFFVTARGRLLFFLSGAVMILLITSLFLSAKFRSERIVVFYGGESQEPAIVAIPDGGSNGVTVINPGSKQRGKAIISFLQKNGINSIDYLIFTENRKSCCESAWLVFAGMDVCQAIFLPGYKHSRYAKFAMKKALASGADVKIVSNKKLEEGYFSYSAPGIDFIKMAESDYKIRVTKPLWSMSIDRQHIMQGEKKIIISTPNHREECALINTNRLKFIDLF